MAYQGTLRDFLIAVGRGESDLEASRQRLSGFQDYNPQSLFNRIDRSGDGSVTAQELVDFLQSNGSSDVEVREAQVLIDFFDGDGNGQLSVEEFQHIVLPCEDNDLRNATTDRNQFGKAVQADEKLNAEVESGLVAIIDREIRLQRDMERLKRELGSFVSYTSLSAYHDIERYEGKIDTVNLDAFLRFHGHFATDIELLSIIRRMDADGDATVSFTEWSDFLRSNAALAPVPPPLPAYLPPRPYLYDPIYHPSYRYDRYHPSYYHESPYYYDRLHYSSPYYSPYSSPYSFPYHPYSPYRPSMYRPWYY